MMFAAIASTLLAFAPASQDGSVPDTDILSVQFNNGTIARVRVLGIDGQYIKLREVVLDGSMDVRHRLDEFEGSSAFRIEIAAKNPDSYEEHFAMAKRAALLGLPQETGQQVAAAMVRVGGLPDEEAKTSTLRRWSAETLERWLEQAIRAEDLSEAMSFIGILSTRYADLLSEEQLAGLARSVEELERDRATARQAKRQEQLDQRTLEAIEQRLRPIRELIERGDEAYRDAISQSGRTSQSVKQAQQAIDDYTAAWSASRELQERHPDEQSLVVEIESIANHLHDHAILAALHAGQLLAVRTDYAGAMKWVRWVLALDPSHAEALELQRTITIAGAASTAGWGLGWGAIGGPGRGRGSQR